MGRPRSVAETGRRRKRRRGSIGERLESRESGIRCAGKIGRGPSPNGPASRRQRRCASRDSFLHGFSLLPLHRPTFRFMQNLLIRLIDVTNSSHIKFHSIKKSVKAHPLAMSEIWAATKL